MAVPNRSDIILKFTSLAYNTSSDSTIDLTAVDDIICSIARGHADQTPIKVIKYTVSPSLFTIDNTAKSVSVTLTDTDLGNILGRYSVNLWILKDSRYMTHLVKYFEVVPAVNYSLT